MEEGPEPRHYWVRKGGVLVLKQGTEGTRQGCVGRAAALAFAVLGAAVLSPSPLAPLLLQEESIFPGAKVPSSAREGFRYSGLFKRKGKHPLLLAAVKGGRGGKRAVHEASALDDLGRLSAPLCTKQAVYNGSSISSDLYLYLRAQEWTPAAAPSTGWRAATASACPTRTTAPSRRRPSAGWGGWMCGSTRPSWAGGSGSSIPAAQCSSCSAG